MGDENAKVCGGILLVRSRSGTSKIQNVDIKSGKTKSSVKCRFQKLKDTMRPSRIPVLIRTGKKESNKNDKILKSVHSSITNIRENSADMMAISPISNGGDCEIEQECKIINNEGKKTMHTEVPDLNMTYSMGSIHSIVGDETHTSSSTITLKTKTNSNLTLYCPNKNKTVDQSEEQFEDIKTNLVMADSKVDLLYENENKDSAIHITYSDEDFEDDEDEFMSLTKIQESTIHKIKAPTIVMAQYSTTFHTPFEGGERPEAENEEFEVIEHDSDSSTESVHQFLDSGLRRLNSQESRLYLDTCIYKDKRKPPTEADEDGVKPLLQELPSDIFQQPRRPRRREVRVKTPTQVPSREDLASYESVEDEVSKTPSESSEIDTRPLDKLKELEDKTFTLRGLIDAHVQHDVQDTRRSELILAKTTTKYSRLSEGSIPEKTKSRDSKVISKISRHSQPSGRDITVPFVNIKSKLNNLAEEGSKDDFCVHTKDVPAGDLHPFSSSDIKPQKSKRSSIFRIFKSKDDDFCVHTNDPARRGDFSSTTFDQSQRRSPARTIHSSRSQGSSTVTLRDNKEARRLKYSKKSKNW